MAHINGSGSKIHSPDTLIFFEFLTAYVSVELSRSTLEYGQAKPQLQSGCPQSCEIIAMLSLCRFTNQYLGRSRFHSLRHMHDRNLMNIISARSIIASNSVS
jgi:hypothetical protein